MAETSKHWVLKAILIIWLLLGLAAPTYADIGVPMLAVVWPASWVLLIPVIMLEAFVAMRIMKQGYLASLKVSSIVNLISTIVGIPVTWAILVAIEMVFGGGGAWGLSTPVQKFLAVTVQSPWLIPYDGELHWMVPTAAAVLCVPFFLMSVLCENIIARYFFIKNDQRLIWRWAWIANAVSYGLIVLWPLFVLYNTV